MLFLFVASALFAVSAFVPSRAAAQVPGGSLTGMITSEAGAAVPGVTVSVRDDTTGVVRTVTTGTEGLYNLPALPPGNFEMTVSTPGFVTQLWTGINIAVGGERVLNVTLRTGNPQTVVRNIAPAAPLSQNSGCCGGNVNASAVQSTPLNGRDWTQLATLQAGVTGVQTGSSQGGGNVTRGFGAPMSISGARPEQNNFRVDGISINDYANGAPGSVLGDSLGVDAVDQVSVLGSNYPAEYGRTSGGVINAATRSGSNSFHGSVYEVLRNSAFDARNFFDAAIPPFKRNQFGGSLGGPIQKERTFFFVDYEGLRQSLGVTTIDTVPSPAALAGNLCSIPSGLTPVCTPVSVPVDASIASFLKKFFPSVNGPLLGHGDTGIFSFAGQQVTNENYVTTRIDRKLSQKDTISGTYMHDNSKTVQPDAFNSVLSNVVSARQFAVLHEGHAFSAESLNALRFGFNRAVAVDGGITEILNPLLRDTSFGFIPGQFPGSIFVPGITPTPSTLSAQNPGFLAGSDALHWTSFQAGDDVFLTRGVHALKLGAVLERIRDDATNFSFTNGTFRFSSLADLLTNRPRVFSGQVPGPVLTYGTRQTLAGAYFEDDIEVRRNLTLNLGLRYEMATVPNEVHNQLSNLLNLTDAQPHLGSPYFLNPTLRDFEPRVGFAWTPLRNDKTILRGGFGIFDVLPLPYEFRDITPNPFPFLRSVLGVAPLVSPGSFPTRAYSILANNMTGSRISYVEHSPKRSYVMQWNLSVAEQFSSNWVATVGYVGSRGVHQPYRVDNINMVLPVLTSAGYLYSGARRSIPTLGASRQMLWQANSFYDALQADLAKRISHGIEFHVAYTWGKSIDTLSATVADDSYPNGIFNPIFFDQRTTRGLSDFNVGQDLVVSYTWELPSLKVRSSVFDWALSGWEFNGIYKLTGGQPFTPLIGGDPQGSKLDETSEPPSLMAGPGCANLTNPGNPNRYIKTQCLTMPVAPTPAFYAAGCNPAYPFPICANLHGNLGRNTLIGPGISKLDFSVFKNNPVKRVSESFNVQFRAEVFNILNHTNFSSPTDNLNVFDQTGQPVDGAGLITSTQTSSRQIQLALKLIW